MSDTKPLVEQTVVADGERLRLGYRVVAGAEREILLKNYYSCDGFNWTNQVDNGPQEDAMKKRSDETSGALHLTKFREPEYPEAMDLYSCRHMNAAVRLDIVCQSCGINYVNNHAPNTPRAERGLGMSFEWRPGSGLWTDLCVNCIADLRDMLDYAQQSLLPAFTGIDADGHDTHDPEADPAYAAQQGWPDAIAPKDGR